MTAMDSVKAKLDEYEYLLKLQMEKIEELVAENQRLMGGADAHTTLQAIYRDPNAPEGNRIKAAAASLPHEKPKMMSVAPPLELIANPDPLPLAELVKQRKERAARLMPYEVIDGQLLLLKPHGDDKADDADNTDN
jgi:hypothetical protein